MDSPLGSVPVKEKQQLWPALSQMHQYLDNWAAYAGELERRVQALENANYATEQEYTSRIAALRVQLAELERPLLDRIAAQDQANAHLAMDNEAMRREIAHSTRLMAAALEVPIGKSTPPLNVLVQDIIVLAEESKEQLRASL